MNIEKIKEVFADKAFVKSLVGLETAAEVQTSLREKGIDLSETDAVSLCDMFAKIKIGEITKEQLEKLQQQAEDGELNDEALEQVAGGWATLAFMGAKVLFIIGAAIYEAVCD